MARRYNTQTARDRAKLVADFERRLRWNEKQGDYRHWLRRPRSIAWVVILGAKTIACAFPAAFAW